ncbi:protein NO VEIN domain-containing protein [Mucispirillum schaedleri]|uniref:protein NO VEIN domain-containing protein n=1 Tax=Mucispirillum schaedleri TaxID=248039 RepID=UPI001F5AB97F|nr:DUF3883 domain-containing protein [Mucispirillum schaedleri]
MKNHLPNDIQELLNKAKAYLYEDEESYNIYELFNNYYNAGYMHQFAVLVLGLKFFMYCIDNNIGGKIYVYGGIKPDDNHIKITKISDKYTNEFSFNFKTRNKKQKFEYGLTLYNKNNDLDLVNCDVTWGRFYVNYYVNTSSIATRYILFDDLENPKTIKYHFIGTEIDDENTVIKKNKDEIKDNLKAQSEVSNYFRSFRLPEHIFVENEKIDEKYFKKLLDKMFITDFINTNKSLDVNSFKKLQEKRNNIGLLGEVITAIYEAVNNHNNVELQSYNNVNAGYDILCKDNQNNEKYIEVKTTIINNDDSFNFYISQNEYNTLKENKINSFLYCIKISDKLLKNNAAYGSNSKTIIFNGKEYSFDNIDSIKQLKETINKIDEDIKVYIIQNPAKKFNLSKYFETIENKKYEFSINHININIYNLKYYSEEYNL